METSIIFIDKDGVVKAFDNVRMAIIKTEDGFIFEAHEDGLKRVVNEYDRPLLAGNKYTNRL